MLSVLITSQRHNDVTLASVAEGPWHFLHSAMKAFSREASRTVTDLAWKKIIPEVLAQRTRGGRTSRRLHEAINGETDIKFWCFFPFSRVVIHVCVACDWIWCSWFGVISVVTSESHESSPIISNIYLCYVVIYVCQLKCIRSWELMPLLYIADPVKQKHYHSPILSTSYPTQNYTFTEPTTPPPHSPYPITQTGALRSRGKPANGLVMDSTPVSPLPQKQTAGRDGAINSASVHQNRLQLTTTNSPVQRPALLWRMAEGLRNVILRLYCGTISRGKERNGTG